MPKSSKKKHDYTLVECKCFERLEIPFYPSDFMRGYYAAKGLELPDVAEITVCNGTRERDECDCNGDRCNCTFYSEVREQARKRVDESKS